MVAQSPFLVFKWVAGTSVAVCEDKIRLCSSTYRLKLSSNRSLVYAYFSMLFFRYQIQNFLEYVVGGGAIYINPHRFMPSCSPFDTHKVWFGLLATVIINADAF